MDFSLTPEQSELQGRARDFVRDVLQPREVEFERAGGRVPRGWGGPIRQDAIVRRDGLKAALAHRRYDERLAKRPPE
jgi:alkylation response protein AidB-like acyl-CoA dehydrogenase